jgi:RND family efflux transporter MFP subunit
MLMKRALGLLGIALFLNACGEGEAQKTEIKLPVNVLVQKVTHTSLASQQTYAATIEARATSDHAFRISGKASSRLVNVGDEVKKGAALATLEANDFQLEFLRVEAELDAAEKVLAQQVRELTRIKTLAKKGIVALTTLDKQGAVVEEAIARKDKAIHDAARAKNAVEYTTLHSEADGVVTDTQMEPGQFLSAGQKAISVARNGEIEALIALPESMVAKIADSKATLSVWSNTTRRYTLILRELSPAADPGTRTFAARFTIVDPDKNLRIGMSAELHLSGDDKPRVSVPLSAIFDQGSGPNVWRVDSQTGEITLRPVSVNHYTNATAQIDDGLAEGELVVAIGAHKLVAGSKVRVVETLR